MPVPWKSILTSWPAWAIGITTFGRIWVHYVFIIPGPMYMKTVLGFSIQAVCIHYFRRKSLLQFFYIMANRIINLLIHLERYPVRCTIYL